MPAGGPLWIPQDFVGRLDRTDTLAWPSAVHARREALAATAQPTTALAATLCLIHAEPVHSRKSLHHCLGPSPNYTAHSHPWANCPCQRQHQPTPLYPTTQPIEPSMSKGVHPAHAPMPAATDIVHEHPPCVSIENVCFVDRGMGFVALLGGGRLPVSPR